MFRQYNANPEGKYTNDCTVRAISKITGKPWRAVYAAICAIGYNSCDMPSSNAIWGEYVRTEGYLRNIIPNTCPVCYSIEEFCRDNPVGKYIVGTGTHVVAVIDGDYYDTWDSGKEIPIYYFAKEK